MARDFYFRNLHISQTPRCELLEEYNGDDENTSPFMKILFNNWRINQKHIFQERSFPEYNNSSALYFLLRAFDGDLSGKRILQIGGSCPDGNYESSQGIERSEKLREYGTIMHNLDLDPNCIGHYQLEDHLKIGSWLDIDKFYPDNFFDAIFVEGMDPSIRSEIDCKLGSGYKGYVTLLEKTLSRVSNSGLFFIRVDDGTCFKLPASVVQLPTTDLVRRYSCYFESTIPKEMDRGLLQCYAIQH
jgi:hypothetical protein